MTLQFRRPLTAEEKAIRKVAREAKKKKDRRDPLSKAEKAAVNEWTRIRKDLSLPEKDEPSSTHEGSGPTNEDPKLIDKEYLTIAKHGASAVLEHLRRSRKDKGVENLFDMRKLKKLNLEYNYLADLAVLAKFKNDHPNDYFILPKEMKKIVKKVKKFERFLTELIKKGEPNAKKS